MPVDAPFVTPLDSAGLTPRQAAAMEKNKPLYHTLNAKEMEHAAWVARENKFYPKMLYMQAKMKQDDETGELISIDGDKVSPGYHAYEETRRGRAIQIFTRHPFKSLLVKSKDEEAAAKKQGWGSITSIKFDTGVAEESA